MEVDLIINIVLAVSTIAFGVAWATLFNKGRKIFASLLRLREEYDKADDDGVITDAEKSKIADTVIEIIGDAADVWQALQNFVMQVIPIIRNARR